MGTLSHEEEDARPPWATEPRVLGVMRQKQHSFGSAGLVGGSSFLFLGPKPGDEFSGLQCPLPQNWLQLCYQSRDVNNFDCLCVLKGTTQPGSAVKSSGYQRRHPTGPEWGRRACPGGPHLVHTPWPTTLSLTVCTSCQDSQDGIPSLQLHQGSFYGQEALRRARLWYSRRPLWCATASRESRLLPRGLTVERSVRFQARIPR